MRQTLEQTMRSLKLGGMAREWADVKYLNNEQYLTELLEIETREREANRMNRMVKQAGFKVVKELDNFIWKQGIEIPVSITREEIESADFVNRKENLIFMGSTGTGKTHLATAIALSLCEKGRHVLFYTAPSLAGTLQEKSQKGQLNAFLKSLKKVELLVLDEIGFITLYKEAAELLFQVVSECYEQRSLIVTSNLEFSQWNTVMGDNKLTAALIDRLIHHSHIVVFSGPGHRLEESVKRQKGGRAI
jgi:DNA replication protein DnaC